MTEAAIIWPRKTRELHNHHFNSTIWNDFDFRDDDIIIATYAKSGTTWMQQIVAQLLFGGAEDLEVAEMSPWLDLRVPPKEVKLPQVEAQHAPALPQDAPAGGRAGLLAQGQVHLHRPRRTRRGVEHVQPPRQRQRILVPGAQRHARPGRPADRPAGRLDPAILPRLAGRRWLPVLALLGEHRGAGGTSAICQTCSCCISPS